MGELSIKIKIADREYPMKVEASEEERIRKVGKVINENIKTYREQYGINDKQDLLAMVAFDAIVQNFEKEKSQRDMEDNLTEKVSHLNKLISRYL